MKLASIPFANSHSDGIIQYIQTQSQTYDILSKNIVNIQVPSQSQSSASPGVMLGINNENNTKHFSTNNISDESKYILFDFNKFTLAQGFI